jgi:hypothetical protein
MARFIPQGMDLEVGNDPDDPTPTSWVPVHHPVDFSDLGGSRPQVELTNLESLAREFTPGLADQGAFSVTHQFDPMDPGQRLIMNDQQVANRTRAMRLIFPDANNTRVEFMMSVTSNPIRAGVDQPMQIAFQFQITGLARWSSQATPGSEPSRLYWVGTALA